VSKSGSPAAKLTTSTPWDTSALAFALRARVGDGLMALSRFARFMIDAWEKWNEEEKTAVGTLPYFFVYLARRALKTPGGTSPSTSPPNSATSRTRFDDT
jgi:hypothetical protein